MRLSPRNLTSCIYKVLATRLLKPGLDKDNSRHAKEVREKTMRLQLYTKNYRQQRNAESGEVGLGFFDFRWLVIQRIFPH